LSAFALLAIPESIATIIFVYFYGIYAPEDLKLGFTFPLVLLLAIFGVGIAMSCFYVYKVRKNLMHDE
jgi:ABC-type polysaccharide/polyol phosphate export permease